jgi:hypothetical protein
VTPVRVRGTAPARGSPIARLILAFCLVSAVACTGGLRTRAAGESAGSNRAACEQYVAKVNALQPCLKVHYDADNLCAVVDATNADMTDYFQCLGKHTSCDKAGAKLDVDRCEPPLVALPG